ncbi:MAG TPA: hypothetical protein VHC50_09320 [Puia sp.]|nr:hypothetical protein [Puia sp.]
MKKNRSGILLIAEIVAIILFHTFKIRASEKDLPDRPGSIVTISKNLNHLPQSVLMPQAKPVFFFLNMLK